MGEAVIDVYNLACKYLYYCGTANSSEMTPIYVEKPGELMSWEQALPSAAQAMHCLFPTRAYWIMDSDIQLQVSSQAIGRPGCLTTHAAGILTESRKGCMLFCSLTYADLQLL